jgi:peroxiredoxin
MTNLSRFSFIFLFVAAGCGGADVTALAPHFELPTTTGETRTLDDLKGKVVLLNFWATWCESCEDELPILQELHNNNEPQSFQLLAVSIDHDPATVVPRYAHEHRITYPLPLFDIHN